MPARFVPFGYASNASYLIITTASAYQAITGKIKRELNTGYRI
jgi:hypothetical protein